jgi:hypothetical protein
MVAVFYSEESDARRIPRDSGKYSPVGTSGRVVSHPLLKAGLERVWRLRRGWVVAGDGEERRVSVVRGGK